MRHIHRALALGVGLGVLAATPMLGCRGDRSDAPPRQFFPDMDDSPKWKPQAESEFYVDQRTMRQPPAGTVAFSRADFDPDTLGEEAWASPWMDERAALLKADEAFYTGRDADGWLVRIPASIEVTRELVDHGRAKFDIYCAVCHGTLGDGQGLVGQRWSIPVANFHDPKYTDPSLETGQDGYLFNTALHGKGVGDAQTMPGYAHAIGERDAWAIVAYIRALQAARSDGGGS
jgi:mono/diheme cytochrome c family protein